MKLGKRNLAILCFFAWGFLTSLPLLHLYSAGDQVHYTAFYDYLATESIRQAYLSQSDYLGSSELVYPLIAWIGSNLGLDKTLYFSFWNATLLLLIGILLLRHNASATFVCLTLFNFYLLVLLTGAERLKFAYIFFLLAALTQGASRWIMMGAAVASHLQALITTAALLGFKTTSAVRSLRSTRSFSRYFLVFLAIVSLGALTTTAIFQLWGAISAKLAAYSSISRGAEELYQIAAITFVGILALKNKAGFFLMSLVLALFVLILGGQRVNMIAVTHLMYFSIIERRTKNPLILVLMLYFAYKSLPFLHNIYLYGDGFNLG